MPFNNRSPNQYHATVFMAGVWLEKSPEPADSKVRALVKEVRDRLVTQLDPNHVFDFEYSTNQYWGSSCILALRQQFDALANEGHEWALAFAAASIPHATLHVDLTWIPWQMRERYRFIMGEYNQVPWHDKLDPIPDHFVHISKRDATKVSYTQNADKGERDIQAPPQRPGRYLTQFYKDKLTEQEIRRWATMIDRAGQVHFAKTPDEVEKVYVDGPSSCMSHGLSEFAAPEHPSRVYGDSDIQIAYIYNSSGNISARCTVWPEKKRMGRIYGDECRLNDMLQELGYSHGSLEGAKIRRIEVRERQVVMPYLDAGGQTFGELRKEDGTICKEFFTIAGRNHADRTDGIGFVNPHDNCKHCDGEFAVDDMLRIDGALWCDRCVNTQTLTCRITGSIQPATEMVEVSTAADTEMWSRSAIDHYAFWCDSSLRFYSRFDFTAQHEAHGAVRASHLPDDPLLCMAASRNAMNLKYWNGAPPVETVTHSGELQL
jgi:hypothetical protein